MPLREDGGAKREAMVRSSKTICISTPVATGKGVGDGGAGAVLATGQGLVTTPNPPIFLFLPSFLVLTWPLETLASPIPHPSIPLTSTGASTRTALVSPASTNGGWPSRHLEGPGDSGNEKKSSGGGSHCKVLETVCERIEARKKK